MKKKFIIIFLILCMVFGIGNVTMAVVTQEEIDNANKKIDELQKERQEMQEYISSIDSKKSDLKTYINELDTRSSKISEKMDANQKKIDELSADISVLESEETSYTVIMEDRYEIMKSRIKYMYETGDQGYISVLLGADSLSEFLNRIEYISKISEYDNNMLKKYEKYRDELAATIDKKQKSMEELEATRETYQFESDSLNQLTEDKKNQLKQYAKTQKDSELILSQKELELGQAVLEVEDLLEKQRKEQAEYEQQYGVPPQYSDTSASGFIWPAAISGRISCGFGPRKAPTAGASTYHKGIDIAVPAGTEVLASKSGKVVISKYSSSAGNYIGIYHGDGQYTYYMHNSSLCVSEGDEVVQGQKIALSGSTGISTGPHIHFGMCFNGEYVNPLNYVTQP